MLVRLEHFVAQADDCEDVECIAAALERGEINRTFSALFWRAYDVCGRTVGGTTRMSIEAIRCGLEHGVSDWKDVLLVGGGCD